MVGYGKLSRRMIGREVAALATAVASLPLRWLVNGEHLDRVAPDETPVVFVHGLLGDPTNFIVLRRALGGGRSFTSFAYTPGFDYERKGTALRQLIENTLQATGARQVDIVGHSLGGLVVRHLVATGGGHLVRRFVTLGAPYYPRAMSLNELAIYGSDDLLVAPDPRYAGGGRVRVVPECGHIGLLYDASVVEQVAAFLAQPSVAVEPGVSSDVREAA
jgi:pimeloyl-ACP methyl ester carboxylesterase